MTIYTVTYGVNGKRLVPFNLERGGWIAWAPDMRGVECDGVCFYNSDNSYKRVRTYYFTEVEDEKELTQAMKDFKLWVDGMRFNKIESDPTKESLFTKYAVCDYDEGVVRNCWYRLLQWEDGIPWK